MGIKKRLRRMFCLHLSWRRAHNQNHQHAARFGNVVWSCVNCGHKVVRSAGNPPINYEEWRN